MKSIFATMFVFGLLILAAPLSAQQSLTEQDLVGHWQCESLLAGSIYKDAESSLQPGWRLEKNGLVAVLKSEIDFAASGSGGYMLLSSAPHPIDVSSDQVIQSPYGVQGDYLVLDYQTSKVNSLYEIRKTDDRMVLHPVAGGFLPVLTCDRSGTTSGSTAATTTSADSTTPTALNQPATNGYGLRRDEVGAASGKPK